MFGCSLCSLGSASCGVSLTHVPTGEITWIFSSPVHVVLCTVSKPITGTRVSPFTSSISTYFTPDRGRREGCVARGAFPTDRQVVARQWSLGFQHFRPGPQPARFHLTMSVIVLSLEWRRLASSVSRLCPCSAGANEKGKHMRSKSNIDEKKAARLVSSSDKKNTDKLTAWRDIRPPWHSVVVCLMGRDCARNGRCCRRESRWSATWAVMAPHDETVEDLGLRLQQARKGEIDNHGNTGKMSRNVVAEDLHTPAVKPQSTVVPVRILSCRDWSSSAPNAAHWKRLHSQHARACDAASMERPSSSEVGTHKKSGTPRSVPPRRQRAFPSGQRETRGAEIRKRANTPDISETVGRTPQRGLKTKEPLQTWKRQLRPKNTPKKHSPPSPSCLNQTPPHPPPKASNDDTTQREHTAASPLMLTEAHASRQHFFWHSSHNRPRFHSLSVQVMRCLARPRWPARPQPNEG